MGRKSFKLPTPLCTHFQTKTLYVFGALLSPFPLTRLDSEKRICSPIQLSTPSFMGCLPQCSLQPCWDKDIGRGNGLCHQEKSHHWDSSLEIYTFFPSSSYVPKKSEGIILSCTCLFRPGIVWLFPAHLFECDNMYLCWLSEIWWVCLIGYHILILGYPEYIAWKEILFELDGEPLPQQSARNSKRCGQLFWIHPA